MTLWEYRQHFSYLSDFPAKELNALGAEGWELVHVYNGAAFYRYIFKRPITPGAA